MLKKEIVKAVVLIAGALLLSGCGTVGYVVTSVCGFEHYSDSDYVRQEIESEGSLPASFHLILGGKPTKTTMVIPCVFFLERNPHTVIIASFRIPRTWKDGKHLDLSKLELTLANGQRENLLPPDAPIRFFFGDHQFSPRYRYYKAGAFQYSLDNMSRQHKASFYSSFWPPTETATLVAEGILTTSSGEEEPFRQVSVWAIEEKSGFRKVRMP